MENKEILNADGSRNWEANILLDNLKRLEQENAELKAEIDTLKSQLDFEVQKKEVLETKNDRLKEELTTYGATGVCEVCSDKANKLADKYLECLQEIKKIAEQYYPIPITMDFTAILDNQKSNATLLYEILQLITKAESEG